MNEGLSWPIEKIEPSLREGFWIITLAAPDGHITRSTEELVAAGIPAEPYPPTPVVITVTRGDQTRSIELDDEVAECLTALAEPDSYTLPATETAARIAVALRELGGRE